MRSGVQNGWLVVEKSGHPMKSEPFQKPGPPGGDRGFSNLRHFKTYQVAGVKPPDYQMKQLLSPVSLTGDIHGSA
jgi:hypothetical protein